MFKHDFTCHVHQDIFASDEEEEGGGHLRAGKRQHTEQMEEVGFLGDLT